MYSRECPECRSLWPYETEYVSCPQCEVDTRCVAKRSMTPRQANLRLRGIEFERWYMNREREREARGEPSPEEKGRAEAEEILELDRQLSGLGNVER